MSNLVDTSTETVNTEFDQAATELGMETADTTEEDNNTLDDAALTLQQEVERQAQIELATGMIAKALRFGIGGVVKVEIEDRYYTDTANAYAVLIIKYFPGGLFALLDKYQAEIGALSATYMLVRVVSEARQKKRETEEQVNKDNSQPATQFDLRNSDNKEKQ